MTAKARYKDTTRARGIDIDAVKKTAEERIKAAKARSFCSACHQKGHWHRDACCPKRKPEVHTVNVAHEIDSLRPWGLPGPAGDHRLSLLKVSGRDHMVAGLPQHDKEPRQGRRADL